MINLSWKVFKLSAISRLLNQKRQKNFIFLNLFSIGFFKSMKIDKTKFNDLTIIKKYYANEQKYFPAGELKNI